jgi:hypothetical protein
VACKDNTVSGTTEVIFIDEKRHIKDFNFDELSNSYAFVKLETNQENIIGEVFRLEEIGSKIFVFDKNISKGLFIFDSNGKYISKILTNSFINKDVKIGTIEEFFVKDDSVYLIENFKDRILIFDNTGKYARQYSLNGLPLTSLALLDEDCWIYNFYAPSHLGNFKLFKGNLNKLDDFVGVVPFDAKFEQNDLIIAYPLFYSSIKHGLFFHEFLNDTIFSIKDGVFKPHFYVKFSNGIPADFLYSKEAIPKINIIQQNGFTFLGDQIIDLHKIILFKYLINDRILYAIYDKEDKSIIANFATAVSSQLGCYIPMSFFKGESDSSIISVVDLQYREYFNAVKNKEFKGIIDNSKDFDNPILIKISL